MTGQSLILYTVAAIGAFMWGAFIIINRRRAVASGIEGAWRSTLFGLDVLSTVMQVLLAVAAVILLLAAGFVTIRPFVQPKYGPAFNHNHLIAMLIDWSAFMFTSAVLENLIELRKRVAIAVTGAQSAPDEREDGDPPKKEVATKTRDVLPGAGKAAAAGTPSVPVQSNGHVGQKQLHLPSAISRDIPDSWLSEG